MICVFKLLKFIMNSELSLCNILLQNMHLAKPSYLEKNRGKIKLDYKRNSIKTKTMRFGAHADFFVSLTSESHRTDL